MAGILLILYIETHWILDCVLAQDLTAPKVVDLVQDGWRVVMPSFCVSEAIANFRTREHQANEFREQLTKRQRDATKMQLDPARELAQALGAAIGYQDRLFNDLANRFNGFLTRLDAVELLDPNPVSLALATSLMGELGAARGDAVVLATVLEHSGRNPALDKAFLSGNTRDFGRETAAGRRIESAGIKYFPRPEQLLQWARRGS